MPIPDIFQPNLFPTSSNVSSSTGLNTAFSNSFSGLDNNNRQSLMGAILPQLTGQISNMPGNIDAYMGNANQMYQGQMKRGLEQFMPQVLEGMNSRGMLNSSLTSDALANTAAQIIPTFADKSFQAGMQGAQMKASMPQILGQLASLGQVSRGSSGSTGMTQANSRAQTSNPLAPYELLSNFLLNY